MREGPWGSHHDEARALKWETSSGETVVKPGSGAAELAELGFDVTEMRGPGVDAKERRVSLGDRDDAEMMGARPCLVLDESNRAVAATEARLDATLLVEICLIGLHRAHCRVIPCMIRAWCLMACNSMSLSTPGLSLSPFVGVWVSRVRNYSRKSAEMSEMNDAFAKVV